MRNFGVVDDGIYRSGKYSAAELKQAAADLGLVAVLDLRDGDRRPMFSKCTYDRIGVKYLREPIDEHKSIPLPTIQRVLRVVENCKPILIHCWKGSHRTGAVVAWYRSAQHWSRRAILAELQAFGYGSLSKRPELLDWFL